MRRVVARGVGAAPFQLAHSVHVEVEGLRPGRDYFYQFDLRGEESAIGHFRTAPAPHEIMRELRFAFATCQDWPSGYYTAYRDMIRRISIWSSTSVTTSTNTPSIPRAAAFLLPRASSVKQLICTPIACVTLSTSSIPIPRRYTQTFLSSLSGTTTKCRTTTPAAPEAAHRRTFAATRAAAYQAHADTYLIPLQVARWPRRNLRIHRRVTYGRLAEFVMLDDRQYRSDNPCGDGESLRCEEALNGRYTMLGRAQERWVENAFLHSDARWNIVGSSCCSRSSSMPPFSRTGSGTTHGTAIRAPDTGSSRPSSTPG